jgi:type IV pilus assembly protein PilE
MWRWRGVTLIELLIVIAVLAILSTIAVSSYRRFALRANRTDATSALLQIQVAEEKHFLQYNSYVTDTATMTGSPQAGGLGVLGTTPNNYYTITLAPGLTAGLTYTATATAINGQTQDDANCQVFTISDQGQRGPANAVSAGCWSR